MGNVINISSVHCRVFTLVVKDGSVLLYHKCLLVFMSALESTTYNSYLLSNIQLSVVMAPLTVPDMVNYMSDG